MEGIGEHFVQQFGCQKIAGLAARMGRQFDDVEAYYIELFGRLADESDDLKPVQSTRFWGSRIRQVGGVKGVEVHGNVNGAF